MNNLGGAEIAQMFASNQSELFDEWLTHQHAIASRRGLVGEAELRNQFAEFSSLLVVALNASEQQIDTKSPAWHEVRAVLASMSAQRARQGFTPAETAIFVFSLKQPLFARLRGSLSGDAEKLAAMTWTVSTLFDELGLYTTEVFQAAREEMIVRQQQELLELSTPVVQLWDNILALPLIGTLDSARPQVVMENLLRKIVETGAAIAIIDITGVPTVDTLVAQHLLKRLLRRG